MNSIYTYIFVICIIMSIVMGLQYIFYSNKLVYEGLTSSNASITTNNKLLSSQIGEATQISALDNVQSLINQCENLIYTVNEKLPMTVSDIVPGTIVSDTTLSNAKFIVDMSYNYIPNPFDSSKQMKVGKWIINAILPAGQPGPVGQVGPDGPAGERGDPGDSGIQGQRGPWATPPS
jgi:hypothetical protein